MVGVDPLRLANPGSIPLADLPALPAADFDAAVRAHCRGRFRPAALAALPFPGETRLVALLAHDREGRLALLSSPLAPGERRPSLTPEFPPSIFERLSPSAGRTSRAARGRSPRATHDRFVRRR
jgi:hypothetical protein